MPHTGERFAPPRVPCLLYAGEREKKGGEEPLVLEIGPEGQMKPPDSWVTLPTLRPYRLTSLQERTGSRRDATPISSGENALPLKVDRRPLLHGGFVCESRYFRLDYKTQNVPSLQVRAVMENL